MKRILLALSLAPSLLVAQTMGWTAPIVGSGLSYPEDMAVDSSGNAISVGFFNQSVDMDPGGGTLTVTSGGGNDFYVQKLSPSGSLVWAYAPSAANDQLAKGVAIGNNGDVYVTGQFFGTVDFDAGVGTHTETAGASGSVFVVKLDQSGNFQWVAVMGDAAGYGQGLGVATDADGNPVVTGSFSGTLDFDPGPGTATSTEIGATNFFAWKLTGAGAYDWHEVWGATNFNGIRDVTVSPGGSVLLAGSYSGSFDADPGAGVWTTPAPGPYLDGFLISLSETGGFEWVKTFGGVGACQPYGVATDPWGNIAVSGNFQDSIDFDPGAGSQIRATSGETDADIFVMGLTPGGNFRWVVIPEGAGNEQVSWNVAVDHLGQIYFSGDLQGTVDFDRGPGSATLTAPMTGALAFVCKLDSSGDYRWAAIHQNASGYSSTAYDIAYSSFDQSVYFSGLFEGTIDFDPGAGTHSLTSQGGLYGYDGFVEKLNQCTGQSTAYTLVQAGCGSVTVNGQTYSGSGTYTQVLANSVGCDSLLTLQLSIGQPTAHTLTTSSCGDFTLNGQTYSGSGTYTQLLTNAEGCDSTLTLELTVVVVDTAVVDLGHSLLANATGSQYQWFDCETLQPIPFQTMQEFAPSQSGVYAVIVTQNGCTDTSGCHGFIFDRVDLPVLPQMTVSPNPSRGRFLITFGEVVPEATVRVKDLRGVKVQEFGVEQAGSAEVILGAASGVYILEVAVPGKGVSRVRLVKE